MVETNQESLDKNPKLGYRSQAKGWTIAGTILYGLPALYFTCMYIALSGMLFDAPGSDSKGMILPILGCYSLLLPVPWPVYLMWRSYLKKRNKSNFPALLILIFYYFAVTVFALIYWRHMYA